MKNFLAKVKAKFPKRPAVTLSVGMVIGIFLVFIIGAAILPTAFSQWFNANTTGWPTATQTLWPLVPLLGIVVIIAILAYKVSEGKHAGV
jgi:L-cystine uptake protein TcyP (sodium:dicarboxylate symporter family)